MADSATGGNALREPVQAALRRVYDPELPVNIYDLGLIYGLEIDAGGAVRIRMTLTTPNCPVAGSLPATVADQVRQVAGVTDVQVELVWDPPWSRERMSPAARLQLNLDLDDRPVPGGPRMYQLRTPRSSKQ
ncbi:MAG: hypothetical protein HJJLKODD_00638 [Phycisphaerae bacterium]|nr:hypothetical protein [Phycisphaerae bacterium]